MLACSPTAMVKMCNGNGKGKQKYIMSFVLNINELVKQYLSTVEQQKIKKVEIINS